MEEKMKVLHSLKTWGGITAAAALAGVLMSGPANAANTVKIGAVAAKTGPLAGGTAVTHWPNIRLWVEQVNARGGLNLKSGKAKIELIEYDDQTNPAETIKAVQRLATQDKADFIIAPYGTGLNLASAPIFAKYGYPQIAVSAITDPYCVPSGACVKGANLVLSTWMKMRFSA
jgi:branched-chain amino acid transport system substrate-binding protein